MRCFNWGVTVSKLLIGLSVCFIPRRFVSAADTVASVNEPYLAKFVSECAANHGAVGDCGCWISISTSANLLSSDFPLNGIFVSFYGYPLVSSPSQPLSNPGRGSSSHNHGPPASVDFNGPQDETMAI